MDTFTSTVIAGLVILLAILIIFNGFICQGPACFVITTTTTRVLLENITGTVVGSETKEIYRPIHIGDFNISFLSGESKYIYGDKVVFNGLMFGKEFIIFETETLSDLVGSRLEFDVGRTNLYGKLEVRVNDVVIKKDKFVSGHHSILIPKEIIQEKNIIEIMPESSHWKIWAPTYYELKNISFISDALSFKGFETNFNIYKGEWEKMTRAKLDILFTEYSGGLIVELNNYLIMEKEPTINEIMNIDKPTLKPGENKLVLKAKENAKFRGSILFLIFFNDTVVYKIQEPFNISEPEYRTFTRGKISFDVPSVVRSGDIIVRINNKTVCYKRDDCRPTAYIGHYNFYFNKTFIHPGLNTITIEGFDGLFGINNLKISLSGI